MSTIPPIMRGNMQLLNRQGQSLNWRWGGRIEAGAPFSSLFRKVIARTSSLLVLRARGLNTKDAVLPI